MAKKLVLITDGNNCITPVSHKLNKDGYFRKNIGNNIFVMYHRYVWEQKYGTIPDGFEVDHVCKNRACCNIKHLRLLDGREHAIISNQDRYAERKKSAYLDWLTGEFNGTRLAVKHGVTASAACRWIRGWKV